MTINKDVKSMRGKDVPSLIFKVRGQTYFCFFLILIFLRGHTLQAQEIQGQWNKEFKDAFDLYQSGSFEKAILSFNHNLSQSTILDAYNHFYLGESYRQIGDLENSNKEFLATLNSSPNQKMELESKIRLGEIAIEKKNFQLARNYLNSIEKRTRTSEVYPNIIYDLAKIDLELKNKKSLCKWLLTLFTRYPGYSKILQWGPYLNENLFENQTHQCQSDENDFKKRLKYMQSLGLAEKAHAEVDKVKLKLIHTDSFLADQIEAQYLLQTGESLKSYELLKPYFATKKNQFNFLLFYGTAAARAGDNKAGIEAHYLAYKLKPKSKDGRQALYQSAFMSYQSLDYPGAVSKYKEFVKKYPNSGLISEAKWHLAWINYLKGHYKDSLKSMLSILEMKKRKKKNWKSLSKERIQYWTAMNYLRLKKWDSAKTFFSILAEDNLQGYYAVAASYRLKKMNLTEGLRKSSMRTSSYPSRFPGNEFMISSLDSVPTKEETETEEDLLMNAFPVGDEEKEEEVTGLEENAEEKKIGLSDGIYNTQLEVNFQDVKLVQRFERARDLMIVGQMDWARWDLFDIERKTTNREHLRVLMGEYSAIENFHRSSYIAQTAFSKLRSDHGMEGVRFVWEHAYPRAFRDFVEKHSKEYTIPTELTWSIMRTESQFRKDAISPVGALGLMQIMPITGSRVAKILKISSFSPQSLLQPETSIQIGTRYLKRLMDQFDGVIPLVAAGYNAGPHRVHNWLSTFGSLDTDEFIEHIPFIETRNYVKKVVSSCQIYSRLYNKQKDFFSYLASEVPFKSKQDLKFKEDWSDI